jgi:SNF2 family DNA or RNA helicase
LVIAPLSTISHWQREFENWTTMNVITLHGSQESRDKVFELEFYYKDRRNRSIKTMTKFNVLITTYETILSEAGKLKNITWEYLVVDEGHRLKNKKSKLLEILKGFSVLHKLLLTGII